MILTQILKIIDPIGTKLERWYDAGVGFIPNVIIAILVLIAFRYTASYISNLVSKLLGKASHNVALVSLISAITKIAVFAVGLFFALGILGLDKTVTSLLAGAGVLALALGFAFQDLTTNFISGAFIAIQRPIAVGDIIETNGYTGRVKSIGLRSVKLDNFAGQMVELPSKDIFQKPIVNFTHSGERRVSIECGVSYQDDLKKVENLTLETIKSLNFLSAIRPVEFNFTKFGENSVDFQVLFWIDQIKTGPGAAKSTGMMAIKSKFDEHGITIPFPVRNQDVTTQVAKE
ncbi:mechanosensitive ion channel family protein [Dyadobacter sp. CY312]|uniref:mechanosensitive ion channel family protein n=1 Tax=Dyadobacter sp. CY312 TaxID=2907303 RepID=UPI001F1F48A6|nr:mechanosensitive ion channel family protein [Dyadobacter sp. CY312]MCE7041209.1 mechanosensitive ion channel [Dyadobacter sp. CY312]